MMVAGDGEEEVVRGGGRDGHWLAVMMETVFQELEEPGEKRRWLGMGYFFKSVEIVSGFH